MNSLVFCRWSCRLVGMFDHPPHDQSLGAASFATTRWSVVISAGRTSQPDSRAALESLCRIYWYPLYAYLRRRVSDRNEAQDLTQAFFVELLEKNTIEVADPQRGRFRAFLITAFKHFLSRQWDAAKALKRGGRRAPIPLDFALADSRIILEPATDLTAEQLYDRQWAITLLEQIMQRLQATLEVEGKGEQFDLLKGFLIGDHPGVKYADVAAQLGMTEVAVKQSASRMRKRYRELLREEIAQTVNGPDEIDAEIRGLFATFEGG